MSIPAGTYRLEMTYSPHFRRYMPLLEGVTGHTAVRIHPGNQPEDSQYCILVGNMRANNGRTLEDSRRASDYVNATLNGALALGGTATIDIIPQA